MNTKKKKLRREQKIFKSGTVCGNRMRVLELYGTYLQMDGPEN